MDRRCKCKNFWSWWQLTWEIPRIIFVDVQLPDELNGDRLLLDLLLEVEADQFFIGRVKPEPGHEDLIWPVHVDIISGLHENKEMKLEACLLLAASLQIKPALVLLVQFLVNGFQGWSLWGEDNHQEAVYCCTCKSNTHHVNIYECQSCLEWLDEAHSPEGLKKCI